MAITKWQPLFERKAKSDKDKAKAAKEKEKLKAEKEKAKAKAEKEKEKAKKKMKENLDDKEVTDVEEDLRTKGEVDSKLQPYQPISFQ